MSSLAKLQRLRPRTGKRDRLAAVALAALVWGICATAYSGFGRGAGPAGGSLEEHDAGGRKLLKQFTPAERVRYLFQAHLERRHGRPARSVRRCWMTDAQPVSGCVDHPRVCVRIVCLAFSRQILGESVFSVGRQADSSEAAFPAFAL